MKSNRKPLVTRKEFEDNQKERLEKIADNIKTLKANAKVIKNATYEEFLKFDSEHGDNLEQIIDMVAKLFK